MKHLYFLFTVLSLNLISAVSFGQNVTTTNTSGPSACDGTAYFQAWSSYNPTTWTFSWYQDSTQIAGNDSLVTGLCPGNYSLVYDSSGLVVYTETFVIGSPCSGLTGTIQVLSTDDGTCSGSLQVTASGGTAPYVYSWSQGATTASITNLCSGTYTVAIADANGCSTTLQAYVANNSSNSIQANLMLADDTTGNCWGGGNSFPTGGTAPYTILWSNGQTGNYSGQLCGGLYSVTIIDQTGDSLVESFIISDPSTTYGNNIYWDSMSVDTLYGNLVNNCIIDYSNIDSASLSQAIYDSISQNLYVTWTIVDLNGNTTLIYDTLGLAGVTGVYSVNISVYCPFKTNPEYFKVWGDFYFNGSNVALAVTSHELENVTIYPNPFTDGFTINNEAGKIKAYSLYTIDGQLVETKTHVVAGKFQVNGLNQLANGTYLLRVNAEDGAQRIFKLIK